LIATDDERIEREVRSFGANIIWTSPSCQNGTERIAEALQKEPRLQKAKVILNLQGDHPLTSPDTLDRIIEILLNDPLAEIATAARPLEREEDFHSPHIVKCVMDRNGNALYFSRSPIPYFPPSTIPRWSPLSKKGLLGYHHIGLYAYRPSFLLKIGSLEDTDLQRAEDLEQLKFLEHGYRMKVALVKDEALGIDTPEDLEKLKKWLSNTSSSPAV
jgi:3-deoxy-manno-octulosonate cytidylyltransferase (CMP-KDO synthetase)